MNYAELTPESMVLIDLDGTVVEGQLRPSSDTPTHRCLYRAFGALEVHAVVHTHSRQAVAFAQAAVPIPCLGTTPANYFFGPVLVTDPLSHEAVETSYE